MNLHEAAVRPYQCAHTRVFTHSSCTESSPDLQDRSAGKKPKKTTNLNVKISTLVLHCGRRECACVVSKVTVSHWRRRGSASLRTSLRLLLVPSAFHPCSCCLLCRAQDPNLDSHLAVWTFSLRPLNLVTELQGAVLS